MPNLTSLRFSSSSNFNIHGSFGVHVRITFALQARHEALGTEIGTSLA